ncbi:MAG: AAA family ATPase [Succinivibrio sp.]|nr:AAA family ATPase [Succinivibrio sp.]
MRRCGKSVLLAQIEQECREMGVPEDRITKINFEDLSFDGLRRPDRLYNYLQGRLKTGEKHFVF